LEFSYVQKLAELLGKWLCEGLVIFKIPSEFLSTEILGHQNQIGIFDFVLLAQGVVFEDPSWKNTVCCA
jgi:hypothetical protein